MKTALILYPNQLFEVNHIPQVSTIFMVEDPLFFGTNTDHSLQPHRQKLVLHRASMRRYVEEVLWPAGFEVEYVEFSQLGESADILGKLKHYDHISLFDPINEPLMHSLQKAVHEMPGELALEIFASPNFYLKRSETVSYFTENKNANFAAFYQWQRERFNILIDGKYHPVGGDWMIEGLRGRVPGGTELPTFAVFGDNKYVTEAREYIDKNFELNQSDDAEFPWPTSHGEAETWLDNFAEHRLEDYGQYQDAVDSQAVWLFHSALASSLNIGLLSPQQLVDKALARHHKKPVDLFSLESFIRQVLGWREYVRAQYVNKPAQSHPSSLFKHTRHFTDDWYNGTTGLPPLDDSIKKIAHRAYVHHAERQMIVGTMMLLAEINPEDVRQWFNEMFIDTYEWMPVPNSTSLAKMLEDENVVGSDFPASSSYLLTCSNYEAGDWTDTWDGLYWRFIEKYRDVLEKHSVMSSEVKALDSLDPAYRRIISYRAEDFLNTKTRI